MSFGVASRCWLSASRASLSSPVWMNASASSMGVCMMILIAFDNGQPEAEIAAHANLTADFKVAAVQFDDFFGDTQPQARSFDLTDNAVERLKNVWQMFLGDADAAVFDFDSRQCPSHIADFDQTHLYASAAGGVVDG